MAGNTREDDNIFIFAKPLGVEAFDYKVRLGSGKKNAMLVDPAREGGQGKVSGLQFVQWQTCC